MKSERLPKHRRPTFLFLDAFDNRSTVHLSAQANMERVIAHRSRMKDEQDRSISYVSYVVWAASRVLARTPEANASFHAGLLLPRIVYYDKVAAKVTFDKTIDGHRIVMSQVINDVAHKGLGEIQERIDYFRDTPNENMPELKPYMMLRNMPTLLGKLAYRAVLQHARSRYDAQGSFTVTSLGHTDIVDFYPITSTTTCFALGAIRDAPVVENGQVVIRPMMPISFSFDHRVLDGALAADVLSATKRTLEELPETLG